MKERNNIYGFRDSRQQFRQTEKTVKIYPGRIIYEFTDPMLAAKYIYANEKPLLGNIAE